MRKQPLTPCRVVGLEVCETRSILKPICSGKHSNKHASNQAYRISRALATRTMHAGKTVDNDTPPVVLFAFSCCPSDRRAYRRSPKTGEVVTAGMLQKMWEESSCITVRLI